jgi:hypothetical protein
MRVRTIRTGPTVISGTQPETAGRICRCWSHAQGRFFRHTPAETVQTRFDPERTVAHGLQQAIRYFGDTATRVLSGWRPWTRRNACKRERSSSAADSDRAAQCRAIGRWEWTADAQADIAHRALEASKTGAAGPSRHTPPIVQSIFAGVLICGVPRRDPHYRRSDLRRKPTER